MTQIAEDLELVTPGPIAEPVRTPEGFLIDPHTGEILGHDGAAADWAPATVEEAEWVLARIADQDAERVKITARVNNLAKLDKAHADRRAWLVTRFGPSLEKIAREQEAQTKKRTVDTEYGSFGLRKSSGRIAVVKDALQEALAWCRENVPESVVIEYRVLVSALKGLEDALPAGVFDIEWAQDKLQIKTGVGE